MFEQLISTTIAQLSSLGLLVAVACSASVVGLFGLARRQRRDLDHEAEIARLHAELKVFTDAAITMGNHFARGERTASAPNRATSATVASTSVAPGNVVPISAHLHDDNVIPSPNMRTQGRATSHAMALAARGAGIDDLVAACELSRSEAGLVIALQQRGRRAASS